ncbi:MAG TPA: type II toxin-antitoxin system HicA family toxin [Deltaproteobacteria bacterium]|nr:type II toxin-antitoxin system HicA family toxin [Deltaproteobacteria bacterium]
MSGLHNLKPQGVVKAFEKAGWNVVRQTGSHVILSREGHPCVLSIPVHKGKPMKQGLLRKLLELAGMSVDAFLKLYT